MSKKKNDTSFLVQGSILAIASLVSRVIGLVYRIPLTAIIGDHGNDYYSCAYEIYSLLLLISSYSLPLAVSKMVSAENPDWEGSPTELAETLQTDMAVNRLTKHLNVNAGRLLEEHHIRYENKTKHAGRRIRLTYMVVELPAVAVTE